LHINIRKKWEKAAKSEAKFAFDDFGLVLDASYTKKRSNLRF